MTTPSVVARPWYDWRSWTFGMNRSVYTFNWLPELPELLDPANNILVMRVESPSPSYWRANALDSFTGSAWVTSQAFLVRLSAERDGADSRILRPAADPTPAGKTVTETFSIAIRLHQLPLHRRRPAVPHDRSGHRSPHERHAFPAGEPGRWGRHSTTRLTAVIPELVPADLVGLGSDYPGDVDGYLTLPFSRVADIAGPDKAAAWRSTIVRQ